MISRISISGVAAYNQETVVEPRKINFFYGSNGVGKTSLSRLIADESISTSSKVEWSSDERERILVFNHDFVDQNFQSDKNLPGIFTLGAEAIETQEEITRLKSELDTVKLNKKKSTATIDMLNQELGERRNSTKEYCWKASTVYMKAFANALVGFRASQDVFFDKCVSEYSKKTTSETVMNYNQLVDCYKVAFAKEVKIVQELPFIDVSIVDELDSFDLLEKPITGKADTPVGKFILANELGDWVKHGLSATKTTEGKCPFCQREMPIELLHLIEDFYDEEYNRDRNRLDEYYEKYKQHIDAIQNTIDVALNSRYGFVDYEGLKKQVERLEIIVTKNLKIIEQKRESPTEIVKTSSLRNPINDINAVINEINEKIRSNNLVAADRKTAKEDCQSQVWRFIVNQVCVQLADYCKYRDGVQRGIKKNEDSIKDNQNEIERITTEISAKEKQLTTVKPVEGEINRVLEGLGFVGFALQENPIKPGTYSIVRPDGSAAGNTLSEGEHNFIAFLYFYFLCFGSQTQTGLTADRIIVIDDPISSLDSNVLYVVATLVKTMISNCRQNEKGIKQVFVLTHNVYFHKEVTFLGRDSFSPKEVTFNIIRKVEGNSTIVSYPDNPIKTSYQILWDELRNPSTTSVKSSLNAMRRILEHYFQLMGGIKYEECINSFSGTDKLLCKSLIAYINDGSHCIFDDLTVTTDEASFECYLKVFRKIFELFHHIDHYNMMMGIDASME